MKSLIQQYQKLFTEKPDYYIFSPGRVNLIGEHTDYSGGMVFPMALNLGIEGVYKQRQDDLVKVYSDAFSQLGVLEFSLNDLSYEKGFAFGNYIKGCLYILGKDQHKLDQGFNLYLSSSLPASSGLSSSAALEMLVIGLYQSLSNENIEPIQAVAYAKAVENDYFHLSSGIMDQFAVQFGKKNHAILLNTKTLEYHYTPFDLNNHTLFLMNTNKTRNLEDSHYNERFESVNRGEDKIKALLGVDALGDVSVKDFNQLDESLFHPTVYKRIRHIVNENHRVNLAYESLNQGDMEAFGNFLYDSHHSLKYDFQVSCEELDFLVDEHKLLGAIGARMTGAGFGGTMIALYDNNHLQKSFNQLKEKYQEKFNKPLDIYQAKSSNGVFWEVLK